MAELVWMLAMPKAWARGRDVLVAALGLSQLDLNAIDTVHAIDEQNQYEDEGDLPSCEHLKRREVQGESYLHAIL